VDKGNIAEAKVRRSSEQNGNDGLLEIPIPRESSIFCKQMHNLIDQQATGTSPLNKVFLYWGKASQSLIFSSVYAVEELCTTI
jgi:hypothetical protein